MSDLTEELTSGDYRRSLEALRDRLAAAIVATDDRYVAPLAKQLTDVIEKLEGIKPEPESKVDDLAERRTKRRAAASNDPGHEDERGTGSGRARRKRGAAS